MVIENLARFLPACSLDKVPMPVMIQTLEEDSYVRFLDVKEASSNSLQQLKAEITACVDKFSRTVKMPFDAQQISDFMRELRQLSAV